MKRFLAAVLAGMLIMPAAFAKQKDAIKITKSGISGVDERIQMITVDLEREEEYININYVGENYLILTLDNPSEGVSGFTQAVIDFDGNWIIEPGNFSRIDGGEDFFAVQKYSDGKFGYISFDGEYVIPPTFDFAKGFCEGLAFANKGEYMGYIDKTGEFVKIFDGDSVMSMSDGVALIEKHNYVESGGTKTSFQAYDADFNLLFETDDYSYIERFSGGAAAASEKSIFEFNPVLIDKHGEKIYEFPEKTYIQRTDYGDTFIYRMDGEQIFLSVLNKERTSVSEEINASHAVALGSEYFILNVKDGGEYKYKIYNKELDYAADIEAAGDMYLQSEFGNIVYGRSRDKFIAFIDTEEERPKNCKEYKNHEKIPENKESKMIFKVGENRVSAGGDMKFIDPDSGDVRTFIKEERIMLPARCIADILPEYYTYWDEDTKSITIAGDKKIVMTIGKPEAKITEFDKKRNDYIERTVLLDSPPCISEDRTFIPLRFAAEITDREVAWNDLGIAVVGTNSISDKEAEEYSKAFDEGFLDLCSYPIIDGSTATIPLSEAMTAKALGISREQAAGITYHTKTSNAFQRLINREADLILSGGLNEQKIAQAAEKGIELEAYALAKEGFVFMLNGNNPVKNLTTTQIQDIYQGKITNWSELGGNDAEIIPFQRNANSGSQSIMKNTVMKGLEMMTPKTETLIGAMGEIVDAVAEFDNSENSIGYSVYYYFSQMHNRSEVALASVDGVEPNDDNIRDGSYPFTIEYCVMIRKDEPEDSPVRKIVNFLLSEEGAKLVSDTGFVSVR